MHIGGQHVFCVSQWCGHRACGEQRRQADGVYGAAVQQAKQRAGHLLLSRLVTPRQQHPTRRERGRPPEAAIERAGGDAGTFFLLVAADR